MNYYEHHIGDFLKKTAHLSIVEEGIYRRLLDRYYIVEGPLPADLRECCKLARAASRAERLAVSDVLREFFDLRDDGWHQKRADEEIARYQAKQPEAEARKESDRERQRRARERRKQLFDDLRAHGIVAPWDATTEQLQAALSRATSEAGHAKQSRPVTQPVTRDNTATHSPDTRHQTPEESASRSSRAPAPEPPAPTLAGQACRLMREAGIPRVNPSDPRLLQLLSQGVTPQQLGDLAAELRESGNAPETSTYVLKAMEGRLRAAAAMPQHPPGTAQRAGQRPGSAFGDEIDRISAAIDGRTKPAKPEPVTIEVEARRVG